MLDHEVRVNTWLGIRLNIQRFLTAVLAIGFTHPPTCVD